jgi:hypothetical protein
MNAQRIRRICKPIASELQGIKLVSVTDETALSESPIYCIRSQKTIYINIGKLPQDIVDKPELLMFIVLHEVQEIKEDALMADLRFDRQALVRLIEIGIDITKISMEDFDALLDPSETLRLDRLSQLQKLQNGNI